MALEIGVVFDQLGVPRQLLRDVGMAAKEFAKVAVNRVVVHFLAKTFVIGARIFMIHSRVLVIHSGVVMIHSRIFGVNPGLALIGTIFRPREVIRIASDLVANIGVVLEISLQRRMLVHKLVIVQKRRIAANLFGNFAMAVEEMIEIRDFISVAVITIAATIEVAIA